MTSHEHVLSLLQEIGPAADLAEVYASDSDFAWSLVFQDGLVVALDLEEETGRITFSMEVDEARPDRPNSTLEMLLRYNYLWQETGGVRMALDGEGGQVVMLYDMPAAALDMPTFISVLQDLAEKAQAWIPLLAAGNAATPAPAEDEADPLADIMRFSIRA